MFQAIGNPWHRLQPLLFDRSAVDQAFAKCPFLDALQRVSYLLERSQIDICSLELLVFFLVSDARITPIANRRTFAQVACVCIGAIECLLGAAVLPPVGAVCTLLCSRSPPYFGLSWRFPFPGFVLVSG